MTKQECLDKLAAAALERDTATAHCDADDALLEYINDEDIAKAYWAVDKWYE